MKLFGIPSSHLTAAFLSSGSLVKIKILGRVLLIIGEVFGMLRVVSDCNDP